MVYITIFLFITLYLYNVEKYFSSNFLKQFIFWLPAFIVYWIFPSMQYEVGTDYQTYFQYYYNGGHDLYITKNEIIYYYIVEFTKFLGSPQFQFFIVSFIQSILFFYFLFLLKMEGYKIWLIFLIFFLCTGNYHNQMNGLRQYICIYAVPIMVIYLYKKKNINFLFYSVVSYFIHTTSMISSILILILSKIKFKYSGKFFLIIFILTFFIYLVNFKNFIIYVFEFFDLRFLSYVDTEYTDGKDVSKLITKFYYLPIIIIFWVYYLRDSKSNERSLNNFFILIFSITFFMFLQSISFELMVRVWLYFNIFVIFPIYYVLIRSNRLTFFIILIYMLIFYLAKVLFFPVAEYEYHIYREWF